MSDLLTALKDIVGPKGYLTGDDISPKYYRDLMGARKIPPVVLLRPANTQEVSQILALCHEHGQPVVPQGGMTGLVSAGAPLEGEICLSLERMNKILEIDPYTATMTLEAGVPLQTVQEAATEQGLLFPLDLGARGTATIGGNLATNAGGNRVIRYGMARELAVGLEAVLADGQVINDLRKLRKNNTGFDLKQLFIGSEGTLGVITQAVVKLFPKPASQQVAFCALADFQQVAQLLVTAQAKLGARLTAFEVLWHNTYDLINQHLKDVKLPFAPEHGFYVLVEAMGDSPERDSEQFSQVLGEILESGVIADAVIAQSDREVENLWRIRDAASEVPRSLGRMHAYDVSMAVNDMQYFGEQVVERIQGRWPDAIVCLFGHIGDGNLLVRVLVGPENREAHDQVDELVYSLIQELHGSVSAEHGIGMLKREYLAYSRSASEIEVMKTLKQALDPKNILSPGRIFELSDSHSSH